MHRNGRVNVNRQLAIAIGYQCLLTMQYFTPDNYNVLKSQQQLLLHTVSKFITARL